MYQDWTDADTARDWSADPTTHNPLRVEQLDIMLAILQDLYQPGTAILDIGMGSGIVEELIFKRIPGAQIVGIDSSEAMVELARERLHNYRNQYTVVMHDLRDMDTIQLPAADYGAIISVQTIHNVPDEHKRKTFALAYRTLKKGGVFLLLDRIAVETPALFDCYSSLWKRQENVYGARLPEGATFAEHGERVTARGDLPASLEQHLQWLREAGFSVACLHLHGNRALFAAKREG